jgi:hypothetical protein
MKRILFEILAGHLGAATLSAARKIAGRLG